MVCLIGGVVFHMGGKENQEVGGKKGCIYSSSCHLVHIGAN